MSSIVKETMMTERYQLMCEYIHCKGIHSQNIAVVETEAEAQRWVDQQRQGGKRPPLSKDDPIRTCPVVRCPLKVPTPRYTYKRIVA